MSPGDALRFGMRTGGGYGRGCADGEDSRPGLDRRGDPYSRRFSTRLQLQLLVFYDYELGWWNKR